MMNINNPPGSEPDNNPFAAMGSALIQMAESAKAAKLAKILHHEALRSLNESWFTSLAEKDWENATDEESMEQANKQLEAFEAFVNNMDELQVRRALKILYGRLALNLCSAIEASSDASEIKDKLIHLAKNLGKPCDDLECDCHKQ